MTIPQLPTQPHNVTVGWADREQAKEDLALRRVQVVLRLADDLYTLSGPVLAVDGYARSCKRLVGATVIRNIRGL